MRLSYAIGVLAVALVAAMVLAALALTETDLGGTGLPVPLVSQYRDRIPAYSRAKFRHWTDADKDGRDTRDEVLAAEDHGWTGEPWTCPYTGAPLSDKAVDIDHLVPLKEAWVSGAWQWTPERRAAFANDLDDPDSLVAVSASANRAKGSKDPAKWVPTHDPCRYLIAWSRVKRRWLLEMDPAETAAIVTGVGVFCPEQYGSGHGSGGE